MSEILLLLSLRFRGGAEQERGTGACGKLILSLILLVSGCCMGAVARESHQHLRMELDRAADRNSVAPDANTAASGCSRCGLRSSTGKNPRDRP
jgi:hypothetical protein